MNIFSCPPSPYYPVPSLSRLKNTSPFPTNVPKFKVSKVHFGHNTPSDSGDYLLQKSLDQKNFILLFILFDLLTTLQLTRIRREAGQVSQTSQQVFMPQPGANRLSLWYNCATDQVLKINIFFTRIMLYITVPGRGGAGACGRLPGWSPFRGKCGKKGGV